MLNPWGSIYTVKFNVIYRKQTTFTATWIRVIMMSFLLILVCGCSSLKVTSYRNWDLDNNGNLSRYEFVSGYIVSHYFQEWSGDNKSISYNDLYDEMFDFMNFDQDDKITQDEFFAKIPVVSYGDSNVGFTVWDDNADSKLERKEFIDHMNRTQTARLWDESGDGLITEREFAGRLFDLFDGDRNSSMDPFEFKIWKMNR